jgi:RNA polymerase sigma-70 factor, ECF subfamily
MSNSDTLQTFERERAHLRGIAYRMTGSLADADDVLQEAFLRFQSSDALSVQNPRAFLSRLVTRLCLDQLKSARVRREQYVGTWLPEPVLDANSVSVDAATELAHDISVALLLALERLSPLERAAFLLHDVFDVDYDEVGKTLERSEAACRQLVTRARTHVRSSKPRHQPTSAEVDRVLGAFAAAAAGDTGPLGQVLAEDAVYYSDGGGRVHAATRPVYGRDRILRFVAGVMRKNPPTDTQTTATLVNGLPGVVLRRGDKVKQTMAFEIEDGRLIAVYSVRNPDKFVGLAGPLH